MSHDPEQHERNDDRGSQEAPEGDARGAGDGDASLSSSSSSSTQDAPAGAPAPGSGDPPLMTVAPFMPGRLDRQMRIDALLRWSIATAVGVVLGVALWFGANWTMLAVVAVGLVIASWMALNLTTPGCRVNCRSWRR